MKKSTMILSIFIAIFVSSCQSQAPNNAETEQTPTTSETTAVTSPLPERDFDGRTVKFYLGEEISMLQVKGETGDIVDDITYARNRKVEELYHVSFDYTTASCIPDTWNVWYSTLESSILADDQSIDIAGGYAYRLISASVTNRIFQNLLDSRQIDISQPWWPGNFYEAAKIGDKLFSIQGHIDPSFDAEVYAMIFNKRLAEDYNIENLYDLVKTGNWTFDKLKECAAYATFDLDGNSTYNEKDQYGYATAPFMHIDGFNYSFGLQFVGHDADNMPTLNGLSEKLTNVYAQMQDFIHQSGHVYYGNWDTVAETFHNGQVLIAPINMRTIPSMRDMEDDFGIIPYPKWDTAQESYLTFSAGPDCAAAYCVPMNGDADMTGCILEALAYYGYQDILPEYFERALKAKNTRDNDSAEMLDIIYNNIYFDFTQIYSFAFGEQKSPSMLLRTTVINSKDIASAYAADENLYKSTLQELIDTLK